MEIVNAVAAGVCLMSVLSAIKMWTKTEHSVFIFTGLFALLVGALNLFFALNPS